MTGIATAPARPRSGVGSLLRRPEVASLSFLLVLVAVLSVTLPAFATPANLQGIVSQVAVTGVVALAVNQVILSGEIDISTGSLLGFAVAGAVAERTGEAFLSLPAAVASASPWGRSTGC